MFALCVVGKFGREELVAKSVDQLSSESPVRRRQNHNAPPSVANPAATAFPVGRREPFVATDFAFCLATFLLTFQTAQPRTALRLLRTPMARGYPTAKTFTHSRKPPPERLPVERGMTRAEEEEQALSRPRTR